MTILYNLRYQKKTRQKLRNNMPPAEKIVWKYLRKNQIMHFKFRRQYGIGRYIVDFYCPALQLAIEIDGPTHYTDAKTKQNDKTRQQHLEEHGIHVLRFTNQQVYHNPDTVIKIPSQPSPLTRGRIKEGVSLIISFKFTIIYSKSINSNI
jgi:very-short-patch-repair endonuclease